MEGTMATVSIDVSAMLKGIPEGAWVAISELNHEVIAYAADLQTALSLAHERGESNPLILRVPERTGALLL
jgi:hypothetical protein